MSTIVSVTFILLFIAGYWSLVVFPKQRAFKQHQHYVETLNVGDEVITYGGLIGTITELNDDLGTARLQLAEGLEVRILTAALQRQFNETELAESIRMARGLPAEAETVVE